MVCGQFRRCCPAVDAGVIQFPAQTLEFLAGVATFSSGNFGSAFVSRSVVPTKLPRAITLFGDDGLAVLLVPATFRWGKESFSIPNSIGVEGSLLSHVFAVMKALTGVAFLALSVPLDGRAASLTFGNTKRPSRVYDD